MAGSRHNGHDPRHVTETPDVSHIKNLDVTHEASDVSVSGVAKFVVGLTVLGIVVFALMWGLFDFLNAQEDTKEPPPGPMAMSAQERLPAEPPEAVLPRSPWRRRPPLPARCLVTQPVAAYAVHRISETTSA